MTKSYGGLQNGAWNLDSAWFTIGQPTAADDVVINGNVAAVGNRNITGSGVAKSVIVFSGVGLAGTSFSLGAITVGARHDSPGSLLISSGTVNATSVSDFYGPLTVSGASTELIVSGLLSIGGDRSLDQNPSYVANEDVSVGGGALVQVGSVAMVTSSTPDTIKVDATSRLEVGFAGGTAAGTLTVDAGQTVLGNGDIGAVNGIVVNGTMQAAGYLRLLSFATGSGLLQINAYASLFLDTQSATTIGVTFTGTNGRLYVAQLNDHSSANPALKMNQQGVITGFNASESIYYFPFSGTQDVTGVSYAAGANGIGTLTLFAMQSVAGTLKIAGDYTGQTFQIVNDLITVVPTPPPTGVSPGTAGPDVYVWTAAGSAAWNVAGNWKDLTTGATPSIIAPGVNNLVTISNTSAAPQVITGPGNAKTLRLNGANTLAGVFNIDTLTVGAYTYGSTPVVGTLTVAAGTTLSTGSVLVQSGSIAVTGTAARFVVAGTLDLGAQVLGSAASLSLSGGASAQALAIGLNQPVTGTQSISIDNLSNIEIGSGGSQIAGRLLIDANGTLAGAGTVTAANGILNQGGIVANGGGVLTINSEVSGAGKLQLVNQSTLNLAATSYEPVDFADGSGTLAVTTVARGGGVVTLTEQGLISFMTGAAHIHYSSTLAGYQTVTSATFALSLGSTSQGYLTLANGASTIGSLRMLGPFTGLGFAVTGSVAAGWDINLVVASHEYRWIAPGDGAWSDGSKWRDLTLGTNPAYAVPSSIDYATITGGAGGAYQTITGPGVAASLTLNGATTLHGAETVGTLIIGGATVTGALQVDAGSTLTTGSAAIAYGTALVSGAAATLTVTGGLSLGQFGVTAGNTLTVASGGSVTASALGIAANAGATNGVAVDATSRLEIGSAGGAALGAITVDAGRTVAGAGSLSAANGIVNNGVIRADTGPLTLSGPITGAGQLQIAASSLLSITGSSTEAANFVGAGGTLSIAAAGGVLSERGLVSGFNATDTILCSAPVSSVVWAAGAGGLGTLTLRQGTAVVGTLNIQGDYSAATFIASAAAGGSAITLKGTDPLFDRAYYLAHNPDVAAAGVDPYQQFLSVGWTLGRDPSAGFSTLYYLLQNADVKAAGINPLLHFEANGAKEGRSPNGFFNTQFYLNQNADVAASGINPLLHFLTSGWKEGRDPSAAFSISKYLAANPDIKAAGIDPLTHYLENGQGEGRAVFAATPHVLGPQDALVDAAYYYAQHPGVAASGQDATAHFRSTGAALRYNPDALFDTNFYLTQNPDVAAAGIDPLAHFEASGWKEGRAPSLVFDDAKYLAANPDVKAAGLDPLVHYLGNGQTEGRLAFLAGGTAVADPLVNAAYYDKQLGATLIPTGVAAAQQAAFGYDQGGWQKGLNPDAFFDTNYYLSHNPDVAAAHVDPLLHYENSGWHEGRDPSAQFSTNKYLAAYSDVKAAGLNPLLHYVASGQAEGRSAFVA